LPDRRLLIVGYPEEIHVGAHLLEAAAALGIPARLVDVREAYRGPAFVRRVNWWLRGRRPTRLRAFSRQVTALCAEWRPTWLLATGIAPVDRAALKQIQKLSVRCVNYLTDDPWNPAHRAPWFLATLPQYDHVFSTRRANLDDLRRLSSGTVSYLPFARAPRLHFPEPSSNGHAEKPEADVFFAGGADPDRVPYLAACIRAGFRVRLHGGYWDRYPETRDHARGHVAPNALRQAMQRSRVALCLVRRANRDGHVMRSYEIPAIGACMLTEDTAEHREIFGADGENVVYFRTIDEMVDRLRWLLAHDDERARLAQAAHGLIVNGKHTYRDRLETMLARG
jgi:spore maturation protein CgeB